MVPIAKWKEFYFCQNMAKYGLLCTIWCQKWIYYNKCLLELMCHNHMIIFKFDICTLCGNPDFHIERDFLRKFFTWFSWFYHNLMKKHKIFGFLREKVFDDLWKQKTFDGAYKKMKRISFLSKYGKIWSLMYFLMSKMDLL